jgi:H+/Cl- antiporter ClcA
MIYTLVGVAVTCALLAYIGEEAIRLIGRLSTAVNRRVGIADHQMWSPPTAWRQLFRPLAIIFLGCVWVFLMFRHATRPARRRVISHVLQHIYQAPLTRTSAPSWTLRPVLRDRVTLFFFMRLLYFTPSFLSQRLAHPEESRRRGV